MYGRVEVFPDQSVMLNIPVYIRQSCTNYNDLLDEILLCDIPCCQVPNAVDRHYANILYSSKKILKADDDKGGFTLKEMRYLQTPDLSVDFMLSSRWSRITSLIYSQTMSNSQVTTKTN